MHARILCCLTVCASACTGQSPERALDAGAPSATVAEAQITPPTQPTPAFLPAREGKCTSAYQLQEGTCVHRFYAREHAATWSAELHAYQRGAAPPMLGVARAPRVEAPVMKQGHDPGSLMKRGADGADASSPRQQRLAELDAMLAAAREKLRDRDEAARAKHVAAPDRPAASPQDAATPQPPALPFAGAAPAAFQGSSQAADPEAKRVQELSQIAQQLSGDQLKALMNQFAGSGLGANTLEAILGQQAGEAAH